MMEHKYVNVVDEPEAFVFGPFDTREKANAAAEKFANTVGAESTDEWPRTYAFVAPEDAADYEAPLLVSKEARFHPVDEADVVEAHNRQGPAYDDVPDEVHRA